MLVHPELACIHITCRPNPPSFLLDDVGYFCMSGLPYLLKSLLVKSLLAYMHFVSWNSINVWGAELSNQVAHSFIDMVVSFLVMYVWGCSFPSFVRVHFARQCQISAYMPSAFKKTFKSQYMGEEIFCSSSVNTLMSYEKRSWII